MRVQFKSRQNKKKYFYFFSLILILFFLFFNQSHFLALTIKNSDWFKNAEIIFANKKNLIIENEELKKENNFYKNSQELLYFLQAENKDLKERLGYADFVNKKRNLFDIIQKDILYKSIILADPQGKLKIGDLIFSKYNYLLGEIIATNSGIAKLELFSVLGKKNNYKIFDGGEEKLLIEGEGQGSGIIKILAPRDIEFEDREKVFLVYEKNPTYLIAKLVDIEFQAQNTNKILYFQIFDNLNLLSRVEGEG